MDGKDTTPFSQGACGTVKKADTASDNTKYSADTSVLSVTVLQQPCNNKHPNVTAAEEMRHSSDDPKLLCEGIQRPGECFGGGRERTVKSSVGLERRHTVLSTVDFRYAEIISLKIRHTSEEL